MASYIFPLIGLIILGIFIFFAVKKRNDASKFISLIMVGILFSTFFMVLPTEWVKSGKTVASAPFYSIVSSVLYSFKAIGGRQDIAQLEGIGLNGVLKLIYVIINYITFIFAPILTSSLVLSFFGDFGERMRLLFKHSKKCYVFSELNENSLALAEGIKEKDKKVTLVFCNTKKTDKTLITDAKKLGAVVLHRVCEAFKCNRQFKKYEFCLMSLDEDQNVKSAESIITKNRQRTDLHVTVNAFAESGTNIKILENYMHKDNCFVFENLTADTLKKAEGLMGAHVLFCNTKTADDNLLQKAFDKHYVLDRRPWQKVKPYPSFPVCNFYLLTQESENDFNEIPLKVDNNRFTTEWVSDPVRLRFIDEIAYFCNDLVLKYPLYNTNGTKKISVMIVGCGRLGTRMLKTALWAGQIIGYTLKIRVYDKKATEAESAILKDCPELKLYDIKFIDADITHADFSKKINESLDATYVTVATGDDELNINTAEYLFRLFRVSRNFGSTPPIFTRIRGSEKSSNFSNKGSYLAKRNIHLFGTADSVFSDSTLFNTYIENLGFAVELCYGDNLTLDKNSYEYHSNHESYKASEYSRRSSMATALHFNAKLVGSGVMGESDVTPTDEQLAAYEKLVSSKDPVISELHINEHDRWNAFMRSEGYVYASTEDIRAYYGETGSHKDELSKHHPCLVGWENLDTVAKDCTEIKKASTPEDFKKYDIRIVEKVPDMIRFANQLSKEN